MELQLIKKTKTKLVTKLNRGLRSLIKALQDTQENINDETNFVFCIVSSKARYIVNLALLEMGYTMTYTNTFVKDGAIKIVVNEATDFYHSSTPDKTFDPNKHIAFVSSDWQLAEFVEEEAIGEINKDNEE